MSDHRQPESSLHPIRAELWCPRGPEISWQILRLDGIESLSQTYCFELALACEDPHAELDAMLGADVELLLDRDGLTRVIYAVVAEFELELGGEQLDDERGVRARATLVPAFALLEHELDTRFFLGQSVVEILASRLGEALEPFGRSVDTSRLQGRYDRRDYCVQYGESTYDFCRRLMAEEGIAFMFEPDHEAQTERLVLIDDNASYVAAELLVPDSMPHAPAEPELLDRESIARFEWRQRRRPNRVLTRAHNYKLPQRRDEGEAEGLDRHHHRVRAVYRHDERRPVIDDPIHDPAAETFTGAELDHRAARAARLLERHSLEAAFGRGTSNAIGFCAGASFELDEARDATGGEHEFLLHTVVHTAALQDGGEPRYSYTNTFECGLRSAPFRPPAGPAKPRVQGVLTGVVVGPAPDEVHTDSLGRIKVQIHADRHGHHDEHSSCWIRVAQMWAGSGYGAMVIPRVGMEVVVSFVAGDPDRPLVTGCVYNGEHDPPSKLPEEASVSVFKSSSTPGGEGSNELRIDDADGREQIFVRAQRRMDVRVGHGLRETIHHSRELQIGNERNEEDGLDITYVYGDRNTKIQRSRYTLLYKKDHLWVGERAAYFKDGDRVQVDGPAELNAVRRVVETSELISHRSDNIQLAASDTLSAKGGGRIVVESNDKLELRVGSSYIVLGPDRIDIHGVKIRINSGGRAGHAKDGAQVENVDILGPFRPHAAARSGSGSGGGGRGGHDYFRDHDSLPPWSPNRAPPMPPPRESVFDKLPPPDRALVTLAWEEQEAWCSDVVHLFGGLEREGQAYADRIRFAYADSGALFEQEVVEVGAGQRFSYARTLTDVLPRTSAAGVESERGLLAKVGGATTKLPLRFRFVTKLEAMPYHEDDCRFRVEVSGGEVIASSVIEYVRGWLHYMIVLGDHVDEHVGGKIGGEYYGTEDLRYCKVDHEHGGTKGLVFWDGKAWRAVPGSWSDTMGTKLYGCAVWLEGKKKRTQFGELPWPDEIPPWSKGAEAKKSAELARAVQFIESRWSAKFDFKRSDCLGQDMRCCRHGVGCRVSFKEVHTEPEHGVILAENDSRANASAWPLELDEYTAAHEFGHHLGNPDEYEGAGSVDPSVNGDNAVAGIDEYGLMGGGLEMRRRYYQDIAKAMAQLVSEKLGKSFTYAIVDRL